MCIPKILEREAPSSRKAFSGSAAVVGVDLSAPGQTVEEGIAAMRATGTNSARVLTRPDHLKARLR